MVHLLFRCAWTDNSHHILQEVLLWIKSVMEETGSNITTDQLKEYVWKTLKSGKVADLKTSYIYSMSKHYWLWLHW